jgi:hypothetical protein
MVASRPVATASVVFRPCRQLTRVVPKFSLYERRRQSARSSLERALRGC